MSRRSALAVLVAVVALVLALVPWTVSSDRVTAAVVRQIRNEFGLDLSLDGRATFSLLPIPRLKLQGVRLADGAGAFSATAGQFKGELRLRTLLAGQVRFSEVRIADARIQAAVDGPGQQSWNAALARLLDRASGGETETSRVDRVVVTGSELSFVDADGTVVTEWQKVNAVMRWPKSESDVEASLAGVWNGEVVTLTLSGLTPSRLIADASDTVDIRVNSRLASIDMVGTIRLSQKPDFAGTVSLRTPSLGALARWTGLGLDLRDVDLPVGLRGEARVDADGVEWPKATLDLGQDRLDGALALRLDGGRPKLRATLAGGDLDLGWTVPIADPTRTTAPRGDYDVRLSASGLRVGALQLADLAAGILVNGERLEVSVARATLAGGSVRGRVSAALDGEGRDIRGQVAMDRVDLGSLLSATSPGRFITGTVGGQATFEALGEGQSDLTRHLRGRLVLVARDGEISGIALNEAPRPGDTRRAAARPDWRRGRTRFGEAQLQLNVADGIAEITEGRVQTSTTQTRVRGRISLPDRTLQVQTTTRALGPEPADAGGDPSIFMVDMTGSIDKPVLTAATGSDRRGAGGAAP